jgi:hypothetical protein
VCTTTLSIAKVSLTDKAEKFGPMQYLLSIPLTGIEDTWRVNGRYLGMVSLFCRCSPIQQTHYYHIGVVNEDNLWQNITGMEWLLLLL